MSRRSELDALRGLLLSIMALTHLPTRLRSYSDQPLGFVSVAEGFVFLAAFVAGGKYYPALAERGASYVRDRLWSRALRVYGYHLALLAFAFTIGAALAAATGRPGLSNLLAFYFDSPGVALLGGPLLLYQPPLFDILPMYTIFLALSPLVLELGARRGWGAIGCCSVVVWAFAQVGGRGLLHQIGRALTGTRLPLDALGAFDLLAWQLLWIAGLWVGALHARGAALRSRRTLVAAALVAGGFFALRHRLGGLALGAGHEFWLDKWRLGALRLVNFAALALVVAHGLLPALRWLGVSLLGLLGRASLQVFAVHVLLCVASLSLVVDDDTPLSSLEEAAVLGLTFGAMMFVAWRAGGGARRAALPSAG